jgi:hypothetical protein
VSKSKVRIEFDTNAAAARRAPLFAQAQAALDTQVLKDSNLFAPKADNFLRASGRVDGPGKISYNTVYARYQYYLNEGAHYTTQGTMAKWFEHAKALYRAVWVGITQGFLK